ncbi:uncharacterized protein LOC116767062 [Danaus plexippus]|uniref:uncharacterized protein LOC116767062 n=1 Tax=Danaus plexippus TaxID=13037 RepID=UPI002AB04984|nr:uncharacterized protein LOC116767062 [Danaus plexippus]
MSVEETLNKKCLKCDVNGHNWVSEEEFRVVFPRGYRDCNFFSRPYEYWSMTEEDFKRKRSEEPLILLSSLLEGQCILQKSILVGHSTDTKLFTELLQDKKDFPTGMTRNDGPQPAKKSKLNSYNSNNTVIQNNELKHCFICSNICKCSLLRSLKPKVSDEILPLFSKKLPELPDVQLIGNLNNISIKLSTLGVYKTDLSYEESNISDFDTEILADDESTGTVEHNDETNVINEKNLVDIPLQTVEENSTITEYEDICEDIKRYFHINNVFDIFSE